MPEGNAKRRLFRGASEEPAPAGIGERQQVNTAHIKAESGKSVARITQDGEI
jgi:hypothetical protein